MFAFLPLVAGAIVAGPTVIVGIAAQSEYSILQSESVSRGVQVLSVDQRSRTGMPLRVTIGPPDLPTRHELEVTSADLVDGEVQVAISRNEAIVWTLSRFREGSPWLHALGNALLALCIGLIASVPLLLLTKSDTGAASGPAGPR